MGENPELYDTSEYPKNHPLYSEENRKKLGKMKDETMGVPIAEAVCLRSKMYSILQADDVVIKKAKGVKTSIIDKKHSFHNLQRKTFRQKTHNMNFLRSEKHEIYGVTVSKTSLSPIDTKRWIAADGVNTRAYGYREQTPSELTEEDLEKILELFQN